MKSSSDLQLASEFALLLIGPPKAGKTVFALSFPGLYILDLEKNLGGALRYHKHADKPFDFFFDHVDDLPMEKRWTACMTKLGEAVADPKVKFIFVDGLAMLAQYLEAHILHNSGKGNGAGDLIIAGEKVMNQAQWGPYKNLMFRFIMIGRSCGKPFVVSTHERTETNNSGAAIGYKPMISGQLRDNLAGLFTDCWRISSGFSGQDIKYTVRFAPKNLYQIGNSLGIAEKEMDITRKTRKQIWDMLAPKLGLDPGLVQ